MVYERLRAARLSPELDVRLEHSQLMRRSAELKLLEAAWELYGFDDTNALLRANRQQAMVLIKRFGLIIEEEP